jgi:hypothetical protein
MGNRRRGFTDWHPNGRNVELLANVEQVLADYSEHLPLTLRQVFYRLVARFDFEKTELAYKRHGDLLVNARHGEVIDMDAIRDDGFVERAPTAFGDEDEFLAVIAAAWARDFRLDRQQDQPRRLVVWCEAAGMVPQLERVVEPHGIAVLSSGGFDRLTDKHRLARQWAEHGQPVTVLHFGDHDASGVASFHALAEDIEAFADRYDGDVGFARIALTPEQARALHLPSAPPKPADRRGVFNDTETWQLEAVDPAELAAILRQAIDSRLDRAVYHRALEDEADSRQGVLFRLGLDQRGDDEPRGGP